MSATTRVIFATKISRAMMLSQTSTPTAGRSFRARERSLPTHASARLRTGIRPGPASRNNGAGDTSNSGSKKEAAGEAAKARRAFLGVQDPANETGDQRLT
jgi:hypothetical protein